MTSDPDTLSRLSIYKGWAFVSVTAVLLYGIIRRQLARQERELAVRREAELALGESEERFRLLIEQASDAFFVHDLSGRLVDVQPARLRKPGYTGRNAGSCVVRNGARHQSGRPSIVLFRDTT